MKVFNMNCIVFITLLLVILLNGHITIKYCRSDFCNNTKQHVLCKFQSQEPSAQCIDFEKIIKADKDKNALIDRINSRRNKVATGALRSLSSAGNMLKVIWNEELETFAQRWANQCVGYSVPDKEDSCRDLRKTLVGQNIGTIYGESPGLIPAVLIDLWYMELLNVNSSIISYYEKSSRFGSPHYDYFTQLVWAESYQVGCGGVKFKEVNNINSVTKNRTVYRVVCNFAPAGNRVGSPVYTIGVPCTQCPFGTSCDTEYKALCDTKRLEKEKSTIETTSKEISTQADFNRNIDNTYKILDDEEFSPFDYFSYLHEYTKQFISVSVPSSTCKNNLAVDDFIELVKKKLSSDPLLKDLLKVNISTENINAESTLPDASVAAFVDRIYSKTELPTSTKFTESEYVNSTLLVDLVEAVIFRNSDKETSTEKTDRTAILSVSPVKIQAEFPETKLNSEFTGHYFFPEDEDDEIKTDATESYYDSLNIPVSDVVFEIEEMRRKTTPDFLDDILETDSVTENILTATRLSPDNMNIFISGKKNMKKFLEEIEQENKKVLNRKKRNNGINNISKIYKSKKYKNVGNNKTKYIKRLFPTLKDYKYYDLLRKLAFDLKMLKLNDKFHCSYSGAKPKYTLFCYF